MSYKRSIKEIPLTLEECRKKQHAYLEASDPIIKQLVQIAALSIPKMVLYKDGTIKVYHTDKVTKINLELREILKYIKEEIVKGD